LGILSLFWLAIFYGTPPQTETPSRQGKPALRLAYFPNVTHAPALIGVQKGDFAKALKETPLRTVVFSSGPEAMEALLANAVDVAFVGPGPAINTWVKTQGKALAILAGACSGGAGLVARKGTNIHGLPDLEGRRVGVPQLGGTQDIALRAFLLSVGLKPQERGGNVAILPMKPADMIPLFKSGQLDAAWVPEPWLARLTHDTGGSIVVDERTLWKGGQFTTTVIVARRAYLEKNRTAVEALVKAHRRVVDWIEANPNEAQAVVNEELKRLTTKSLKKEVLAESWQRMSFTTDLHTESLMKQAEMAVSAGYLPKAPEQSALFREVLVPASGSVPSAKAAERR
jgi:NitT/TauT family transport system substrate-binding protein